MTAANAPALLAGALALVGIGQALFGLAAVCRFRWRQTKPRPATVPAISILKPLRGDEPLLETALASFCAQDYPQFQIVFGVQDPADPAVPVVRRLQARFPHLALELVIDPTQHGSNRKVGNLTNMLPSARHDVIVVSDSDIHVQPDYLHHIAATLAEPDTGLVTTLYSGLPAQPALPAQMGAAQINHAFLPGVIMARGLGRQACLGATMALHRTMLDRIGGLAALQNQLADDAVLGQLVNRAGFAVRLAQTVTATTVPETDLAALFQHELRWARTTRSLAPIGFAMSALQYPLFWAAVALGLAGLATWSIVLFAAIWTGRAGIAAAIERVLHLPAATPAWLLPLRDIVSVAVILLSYHSDKVHWGGHALRATRPLAPAKGTPS